MFLRHIQLNSKSKPIGFFILEPGSKVALMPRDPKDKTPSYQWRVLTPSRTWEFTNDDEEEMKGWVRMIARIVNPELTFGMPLATVVARSKRRGSQLDVPTIVVTLIQFLRDNDGINVEGIFRMSGDQNSIKQLKSRFNSEADNSIVIAKDTDVHVVTGTLKYFLRELEQPLILLSCNQLLRAILGLKTPKEKVIGFRKLIEGLPKENAATLQFILKYLYQISCNSAVNLMTTQNLAVVFGPCLIRSEPGTASFQDADLQLNSVNSMVEQYPAIFPTEDLITPPGTHQAPASAPPMMLSAPPSYAPANPVTYNNPNRPTPPPNSVPPAHLPPPPGHMPPPANQPPPPAHLPPSHQPPSHQPSIPHSASSDSLSSSGGMMLSNSSSSLNKPAVPATPPPAHASPSQNDSIYDSSSEEEELEVVTDTNPEAAPIVVTSLDDITDLEGEDGSLDVSKLLNKPIHASSAQTTSAPASTKPRSGGVGWHAIAKPSAAAHQSESNPAIGHHSGAAPTSPAANEHQSSGELSPTSSAAQSAPAAHGDEISNWLAQFGDDYLAYASVLHSEGFKTVAQLADINDEDMKELGVKMAHRKALRAAIDKLKSS